MSLDLDVYTSLVDNRAPDLGADAVEDAGFVEIAELLRHAVAGIQNLFQIPTNNALLEIRETLNANRIPGNAVQAIRMDPYGILTADMKLGDANAFAERVLDTTPILGFRVPHHDLQTFEPEFLENFQELMLHPRLRSVVLGIDGSCGRNSSDIQSEVFHAIDSECKITILGSAQLLQRSFFAQRLNRNEMVRILESRFITRELITEILPLFPNVEEIRVRMARQLTPLVRTPFARSGRLRIHSDSQGTIAPEVTEAFGERLIIDAW
jgi:hypothetical protein